MPVGDVHGGVERRPQDVVPPVLPFGADVPTVRGSFRYLELDRPCAHALVSSVVPPSAFGSAPLSRSRSTRSSWPLMMATSSGVATSGLAALTSAPAASIARTAAMSPCAPQTGTASSPPLERAWMSARRSIERLHDRRAALRPPPTSAPSARSRFPSRPRRAGAHQRLHRVDVARPRRRHQRRLSGTHKRAFGSAPAFSSRSSTAALPLPRRARAASRRIFGRIDVGARADQQRGRVRVVPVGGPVQRGGSVALRRVHVSLIL